MARDKLGFRKRIKLDPLVTNKIEEINIFDIQLLSKFISESGKILPRRITGCSAKSQKKVTRAVKRARNIGLLPMGGNNARN